MVLEAPHSCGRKFSIARHLLGARNSDLGDKDVAKSAICGYDGDFHFLHECRISAVELKAVAVEELHLTRRKLCAKSENTGAELIAERIFVRLGGCKLHQRQRDFFLRQLFTDMNKSLLELVARNEASGDVDDTEHSTISSVAEQHMLLNVPGRLSGDDVASSRQSTALDRNAAAADVDDQAFKVGKMLSGRQRLVKHLREEVRILLLTKSPSFLNHNCTGVRLSKLGPSIPESSTVLLAARH